MRAHRLRILSMLALLVTATAGGAAGCTFGCPTALTAGIVASGSELVLQDDTGTTHSVAWPDGYAVRHDGDALVLTDRFGTVKARTGDRLEMGGGVGGDDRFHGCGDVVVVPPSSSPPAS